MSNLFLYLIILLNMLIRCNSINFIEDINDELDFSLLAKQLGYVHLTSMDCSNKQFYLNDSRIFTK